MKAYILVSGSVFSLVLVAHIWRMSEENGLVRDPAYLGLTLAAAALSLWAWRAYRKAPPR